MVRHNAATNRNPQPQHQAPQAPVQFNRRKTDQQALPVSKPESGFPPPLAASQRRRRRSTEELLQDADSPIKEAVYVSSRILSHSLRIKAYLQTCSTEARRLVKAEFPELAHVIDLLNESEAAAPSGRDT